MKLDFLQIDQPITFRRALNQAFVVILVLAILPVGIIGMLSEFFEYKQEVDIIKNDFIEIHKASMKEHVEKLVGEIKVSDAQINTEAHRMTEQNVALLYSLLKSVYRENKHLPTAQLERLLVRAVDSIELKENESSFFIVSTNGKCLSDNMFRHNVGRDMNIQVDDLGNVPFLILKQSIQELGKGFVTSYWKEAKNKSTLPLNYLSFARRFSEMDWVIGQHIRLESFRQSEKEAFLKKIASYRFGHSGYMFVNTLGGKILITNGRINDSLRLFSPKQPAKWQIFLQQKNILQEQGAGFIEYNWNKLDGRAKEPKISYIGSYLNWNWIVGAGIYLNDIDQTIEKKKAAAKWSLVFRTVMNVLVLIFVFGFTFYAARFISYRISNNITVFQNFLIHQGTSHEKIDLAKVKYNEFKGLAQVTNNVIEQMNKNFFETERDRIYFARLFNNVPEGILITGRSLVVKQVNKAFLQLFGYKKEELIGKHYSMITPSERIDEDERLFYETSHGRSLNIDPTIRITKDGGALEVAVHATPVFRGDKYFATYLIFKDLSFKPTVEEPLEDKEALMHSFFDNVNQGFVIFQFDKVFDWSSISDKNTFLSEQLTKLRLVRVNSIITTFLNTNKVKHLYQHISKLFPTRVKSIKEDLRLLLNNGTKSSIFYVHVDGKLTWIEGKFIVDYDSYKNVKGVFGILNDITKLRKAEKQLRLAKRKAEQSDHLKSAFLSNMSHGIRTPMNAITGFADLLKGPNLSTEEREDFIYEINENSTTLLKLVEDIIDISKIEANQIKVSNERVDLVTLFAQLWRNMEIEKINLDKAQLDLVFTNENESEFYMNSDPVRLKQIISNLLENALKFTDEGEVKFGFELKMEPTPKVEFFVSDTGIGISPTNQGLVFGRFVKMEKINQVNYGGAGLGLAISKRLVEVLGGTLSLDSKLDHGSTFKFSLPLEDKGRGFTIITKPEIVLSEAETSQKATILVAEDNLINFKLIQKILKKSEINLLRAENGVEAVDMVKNNPKITLVLMDVQMPIMDGKEATRQIKAFAPDLPIIAQTAFSLAEERDELLEIGCDSIVTKPIKSSELISNIQHFLQRNIES